jgi:hypothetical protein
MALLFDGAVGRRCRAIYSGRNSRGRNSGGRNNGRGARQRGQNNFFTFMRKFHRILKNNS